MNIEFFYDDHHSDATRHGVVQVTVTWVKDWLDGCLLAVGCLFRFQWNVVDGGNKKKINSESTKVNLFVNLRLSRILVAQNFIPMKRYEDEEG